MVTLSKTVYDKITIIKKLEYSENFWLGLCNCGNFVKVTEKYLKQRGNKSCGCEIKNSAKKLADNIRLGEGVSAFNEVYGTYKRHAANRGHEFDLSKEQFFKITQLSCFYCNQAPSNRMSRKASNGDFIYNGIDRVDNEKGYYCGNVVPCCKTCNRMKDRTPLDVFVNHITLMLENSASWKRVS